MLTHLCAEYFWVHKFCLQFYFGIYFWLITKTEHTPLCKYCRHDSAKVQTHSAVSIADMTRQKSATLSVWTWGSVHWYFSHTFVVLQSHFAFPLKELENASSLIMSALWIVSGSPRSDLDKRICWMNHYEPKQTSWLRHSKLLVRVKFKNVQFSGAELKYVVAYARLKYVP